MVTGYGLDTWFPAGGECRNDSRVILLLCPRYLLVQCSWGSPRILADPCIFSGSLPAWVVSDGSIPFAEGLISQRLTPTVVWVEVTPGTRAWVGRHVASCSTTPALERTWDRLRRLSLDEIESYCSNRFSEQELRIAQENADVMLKRGDPPAAMLPKLDPVLHELIRFGLTGPWDGYEEWVKQFTETSSHPTPAVVRPQPPRRPVRRSARVATPDLF